MNGYIRTMREIIGHKPLVICGASVIVIRDGRLLLQKRADNGTWGYHGGCLEPGENPEEAARRELFEETGLKARSMQLFGTFSGPDQHFVYPNGDEVYVVDTVFLCREFDGEPRADHSEVADLKWFPIVKLPENLGSPIKGILLDFVKWERSRKRPIRNSAKAVIIKDGKLLAQKNKDDWGYFYLLPGGGQEPGESIREALARECMEEISARVEIRDILFVRDYLGKNHEFAEWDEGVHQIEYMFECILLNEEELGNGSIPDQAQVGVEWLDLGNLSKYRIYPSALKEHLGVNGKISDRIYLGDTN